MTKKFFLNVSGGLILSAALTGVSFAQDTTTTKTTTTMTRTEVTRNPDGGYTVIQYPVGKEVVVDLTPGMNMNGSRGMARVMRMGNDTSINLDLSGLPADASNYYVYAVDPDGAVTLLGPANIANGMSRVTYKTPMDKFMLVLSPNEGLTTIGSDTPILFRSSVPKGYAVVNNRSTVPMNNDKQVARARPVNSVYNVPLLGVSTFKKGETEIRINFAGDLSGLKGKAYIDTGKQGLTKIKMRFDDMKQAPKNRRFVLWAVSPENTYTKIGQVINNGNREESEIRGETALRDFGLFVTVEEKEVSQPTGTIYAPFQRL